MPAVQERPFQFRNRVAAHGRSSVMVDCPFCNAAVIVYLWSLNGSGKKLCACGAALCRDGVARK